MEIIQHTQQCMVSCFWPQSQNAPKEHHLLCEYTRLMSEHREHGAKYGLNHEKSWFVCLGKWQNLSSCTHAFQWMICSDLMFVYVLFYIFYKEVSYAKAKSNKLCHHSGCYLLQ